MVTVRLLGGRSWPPLGANFLGGMPGRAAKGRPGRDRAGGGACPPKKRRVGVCAVGYSPQEGVDIGYINKGKQNLIQDRKNRASRKARRGKGFGGIQKIHAGVLHHCSAGVLHRG